MIEIHRQSITKVHSSAIINPVEPLLATWAARELNRVSQEIYSSAGSDYLDTHKSELTGIDTCGTLITDSFELKPDFKNIINILLPVVGVELHHSEESIDSYLKACEDKKQELKNCYKIVLDLAKELGGDSVTIPVLGVNTVSGFPVMLCAEVMVEAVREWLAGDSTGFKVRVSVTYDECLRHVRKALVKLA